MRTYSVTDNPDDAPDSGSGPGDPPASEEPRVVRRGARTANAGTRGADHEERPEVEVIAAPRSAAAANAYAITFRLIGESSRAGAVAEAVAAPFEEYQHDDPSTWLPRLAYDAVKASLRAVGDETASPTVVRTGEPADRADPADGADSADPDGRRAALRRRLATLDHQSLAAAALHHLAGYDLDRVAGFMGVDRAEARSLSAPLDPPPGVTYRELGDPLLRQGAPAVHRDRRRRTVPWRALAAAAVVLALVVWAAQLSGPRPLLGRADPGAGGRTFGAKVDVVPSAGCAAASTSGAPPSEGDADEPSSDPPTATAETLELAGTPTPFRLRGAPGDDPAPLIVALPGYGQTAADFEGTAQLEEAFEDAVVATLEPPAPALEFNAGRDPSGTDDLAATVGVTEELLLSQCVDLSRVHLVGYGPGAQLAGAVACAAPEVYATVTMVGGSQMPEPCVLRPPVGALLTANVDDPVIRPTGGYGPASAAPPGAGGLERPEAESMDEVARRWAGAVGADDSDTIAEEDDTLIERRTGPSGVQVVTMLHPSGAHDWGLGDTIAFADFVGRNARSA